MKGGGGRGGWGGANATAITHLVNRKAQTKFRSFRALFYDSEIMTAKFERNPRVSTSLAG
jgi:hypothetical protein